ncbi:hypothetical protein HHL16_10450 [Pseudoflavitalea sp. G-6-1-2]|uniref:hypothetical protein n=1 Tax=Pseudoflavitalea sp. G-6-1-2 TaxID=2728841 RepID=UPI00146AC7CF|nr:hypothetical protein [Pseudoflavitalea sp. G-6-1-2]NML21295.1 hypothetical protein [Pseudoflavitalea sp. G-6-1-2]
MNQQRSIIFSLVIILTAALLPVTVSAQKIPASEKAALKLKEDSMQKFSVNMVLAPEAADRFRSDSLFTRTFVRALQSPNSFYYPFDSLNISKLYSPDSSFRIFTWQLKKDEYVIMQKGAIQMRTTNGKLKLYPLFDASMFTKNPNDSVRNRFNWIGAIYYKIIQKENQGKKYYTLLGFDDFSVASNKKWIDVLSFDAAGEPVFGATKFSFERDTAKRAAVNRFSIEYKKEAKAYLNYDADLDLIIVDHLISESDEPARKSTYVPDGDYEAFKWEKGRWIHETKQFTQKLKNGEFPRPAMILGEDGKADEKALEEASRRNYERAQKAKKDAEKKKKP